VVAPVREGWPMAEGVQVISPVELGAVLAGA
jgi:hypothetical protein